MKLFDIETGKYLELGKDWLYGGNGILLIDIMQKELNESFEIAIANAMQGNEHALYQYSYGQMKTEPTGTLKTLCDLTGAVVYGGRYVLLQSSGNKTVGDVIKHNPKRTQFDQLPKIYHTNKEVCEILSKDFVLCEEMGYRSEYVDPDYHCETICNAFEEYYKSLRNEENKLKEIINLIK